MSVNNWDDWEDAEIIIPTINVLTIKKNGREKIN